MANWLMRQSGEIMRRRMRPTTPSTTRMITMPKKGEEALCFLPFFVCGSPRTQKYMRESSPR